MLSKYIFLKDSLLKRDKLKPLLLLWLMAFVCPLAWTNTAVVASFDGKPVQEKTALDSAVLEGPVPDGLGLDENSEPPADTVTENNTSESAITESANTSSLRKPDTAFPDTSLPDITLREVELKTASPKKPKGVKGGKGNNANASSVYADYEEAVYQLRIIELESNSQSSLGTGFLVSNALNQLKIATNYHVVSATLFDPKKYRIEFNISGFAEPQVLFVSSIDVVNDLALLEPKKPLQLPSETIQAFTLQPALPPKGETLYSLGNPHNIGMTVVEGNYNGLVEHRFVDQIHFTGAVNSGMSGGPVVNDEGEVVGVNVATAGNQIGFLVPAKALDALVESDAQARQFQLPTSDMLTTAPVTTPLTIMPVAASADAALPTDTSLSHDSDSSDKTNQSLFWQQLATQVDRHTSAMVDAALEGVWKTHKMGGVKIQSSSLQWLDCWGDSYDDKEKKTETIGRGCHSGVNIYLNQGFDTGFIEYEFMFFDAPTWPTTSVYRRLSFKTGKAVPANYGPKKQLGEFSCSDQQVKNDAGLTARVSFCQRQYKNMPNLYDVFYMAVSTDQAKMGAMSHYTLAGVSRETSQRFLSHFIEVLSWP